MLKPETRFEAILFDTMDSLRKAQTVLRAYEGMDSCRYADGERIKIGDEIYVNPTDEEKDMEIGLMHFATVDSDNEETSLRDILREFFETYSELCEDCEPYHMIGMTPEACESYLKSVKRQSEKCFDTYEAKIRAFFNK